MSKKIFPMPRAGDLKRAAKARVRAETRRELEERARLDTESKLATMRESAQVNLEKKTGAQVRVPREKPAKVAVRNIMLVSYNVHPELLPEQAALPRYIARLERNMSSVVHGPVNVLINPYGYSQPGELRSVAKVFDHDAELSLRLLTEHERAAHCIAWRMLSFCSDVGGIWATSFMLSSNRSGPLSAMCLNVKDGTTAADKIMEELASCFAARANSFASGQESKYLQAVGRVVQRNIRKLVLATTPTCKDA